MFCKQCGNKLRDGAVFCTNCGAKQNTADTDAAQNANMEKTIGVFDTVPGVQMSQPVEKYSAQQAYQESVQYQNSYNSIVGEAHNGKVSFIKAISLFFKNYANFSGRASKSEYWWSFLFNIIVFLPISLISGVIPPIGGLCSIALIIPGISIAVRRLHDVGKSGAWWFMGLIPFAGGIILLIQFLKDSEGDNQWGSGPIANAYGSCQFVNTSVNNGTPTQRVVTDNDIYAIAQKHEPVNLNTTDAKRIMDDALGRIVPTYTGIENLAGAMMLCESQSIKTNIATTDTDTLIIIFKALGFYIGQGGDVNVLGMIQQDVLATLKTRF